MLHSTGILYNPRFPLQSEWEVKCPSLSTLPHWPARRKLFTRTIRATRSASVRCLVLSERKSSITRTQTDFNRSSFLSSRPLCKPSLIFEFNFRRVHILVWTLLFDCHLLGFRSFPFLNHRRFMLWRRVYPAIFSIIRWKWRILERQTRSILPLEWFRIFTKARLST